MNAAMKNDVIYHSRICFYLLLFLCFSCAQKQEAKPDEEESITAVREKTKNSSIYELNIRQQTASGTFEAALSHLSEIKALGCDILWLMPIHPIGKNRRKGSLGSYYSISDYKAINPHFGDENDFRELVDSAHALDMIVILDWVANHTAWDHVWTENHIDFYASDDDGNRPIVPVETDWTDVAELDYSNWNLRDSMISAMKYWVEVHDIDGYRCDVAGRVPLDFWKDARKALEKSKEVFMLAEWDEPEMHEAFDMTYAWSTHGLFHALIDTPDQSSFFFSHLAEERNRYPDSAFRMQFVTNHDENSWKQSVFDRYGEHVMPLTVLAYTIPGMPLVYSGQEEGMRKSLRFFAKDTVQAGPDSTFWQQFVRDLLHLKKSNSPLWNGDFGGDIQSVESPEPVIAFSREKGEEELFIAINFSGQKQSVDGQIGNRLLMSEGVSFVQGQIALPPYGFFIGNKTK